MKELLDFIALIIIYWKFFYRKWQKAGRDILLVKTTMYIYLSFVLYFTLMPIITSLPFLFEHPYHSMNLVPFIDVLNGRGDFARQVILNVAMTIPWGFLLPLVKNSKINLLKIVLDTFLLSLGIELLQPLLSGFRTSDITDLITNVLGGIIGYVMYLGARPLITKILRYIKEG